MTMKQTITINKTRHLYNTLAWLIKATGEQRGGYNQDCLCIEKEGTTKIRISTTDGRRLHTVTMPTPDCFDLSSLSFNDKKQCVFHVTKTASSIDCLFDDEERAFPNVSSVLGADISIKLCRLDFDGQNADDRSANLSISVRKLYQSIDAKIHTISGPDWKDHGIIIDYFKDLYREEHDWVVYGSNQQTTLRFQHTDGDVTKTTLFQTIIVHKRKSK